MFKNIVAILIGLSIIATSSAAITEPVKISKEEKQKRERIKDVIENKSQTNLAIDAIAKAQIKQRKKEIEAERKAREEKLRKARLKAKKEAAAKKAARLKAQRTKYTHTKGVSQWRSLCAKYFPKVVDECLLVMKYESGGDTRAVSYTNDHGLMQINLPVWGRFFGVTANDLYNPETNLRLARVIYDRAGGSWTPWYGARKAGLW